MNKIFLCLLLLTTCSTLSAMNNTNIKPAAALFNDATRERPKFQVRSSVIHERLSKMLLDDFVQKTRIHKTLGDKLLYPADFFIHLERKIISYNKKIQKENNDALVTEIKTKLIVDMKSAIIREILKVFVCPHDTTNNRLPQ